MNLLTLHRTHAGLSIRQLAKLVRKSTAIVTRWEQGGHFSITDKIDVAAKLNLPPDALFEKVAPRPERAPSERQLLIRALLASPDPIDKLRLAVVLAEDALLTAECADEFSTESNRRIRAATARLQVARDALFEATRRPLVEALPEMEYVA